MWQYFYGSPIQTRYIGEISSIATRHPRQLGLLKPRWNDVYPFNFNDFVAGARNPKRIDLSKFGLVDDEHAMPAADGVAMDYSNWEYFGNPDGTFKSPVSLTIAGLSGDFAVVNGVYALPLCAGQNPFSDAPQAGVVVWESNTEAYDILFGTWSNTNFLMQAAFVFPGVGYGNCLWGPNRGSAQDFTASHEQFYGGPTIDHHDPLGGGVSISVDGAPLFPTTAYPLTVPIEVPPS